MTEYRVILFHRYAAVAAAAAAEKGLYSLLKRVSIFTTHYNMTRELRHYKGKL